MLRCFVWAGAALCALACVGCETFVDFDNLSGGSNEQGSCPESALFCADFESDKGAFDDFDGNPDGQNDRIADPGPFDAPGNHVMQLTLPSADLTKLLPPGYETLHARFQVKWLRNAGLRAGFYAGGQGVVGSDSVRPASDEWFAALIHGRLIADEIVVGGWYAGMYQNCPATGACQADQFPCVGDESLCTNPAHRASSAPQARDDRWYCIELTISAGAAQSSPDGATGSVDYAVDGTRIGPFEGLWFRSTDALAPDAFWLAPASTSDGPAMLVDDLVISESPIGCP